ncbi:MAG: hypothetical protein WCW56_02955 [Candidatus Paceibacterota bacterium]|jgi:hypothetical protein
MEFGESFEEKQESREKVIRFRRERIEKALADPTREGRLESFIEDTKKSFQEKGFLFIRENFYGDPTDGGDIASDYGTYSGPPTFYDGQGSENASIKIGGVNGQKKGLLDSIVSNLGAKGIETIVETDMGSVVLVTMEETMKTTDRIVEEIESKYGSSDVKIEMRSAGSGVVGFRVSVDGKMSLRAYNGDVELIIVDDISGKNGEMYGKPFRMRDSSHYTDRIDGQANIGLLNEDGLGAYMRLDFKTEKVWRTGAFVPEDAPFI